MTPGTPATVVTRPTVRSERAEAVRTNLAGHTRSLSESWKYLNTLFPADRPVSTGITLGSATVGELADRAAAADVHRLQELLKFLEQRREASDLGLEPLLAELVQKALPVGEARDAFLGRFYRAWLDAVHAHDDALRHSGGDPHEQLIDEFRTLDRESVRDAAVRIRQKLLNDPAGPRATDGDAPGATELGTLLREVNKKARHLPLRHLFARTPTLLRRLKPCLMMSPLAVSTYLDSGEARFDLVIFDEASQVRPHDAISAIYRGKQLVVAGDQKQLPPTNFFERTVDDGGLRSDDGGPQVGLTDYESILDVCCTLGLPRRRLRWHYRSRREAMIAFSNRHFYDNDLVSFPSVHDVDGGPAVRFEYLSEGRWLSGPGGGCNPAEARRTGELVFEHFRDLPGRTLGVIAFSRRQQLAILDALEKRRGDDPSMESFFDDSHEEAFFVKNLENVQGDERDVIFLSVAYGPDENREGRDAVRPAQQARGRAAAQRRGHAGEGRHDGRQLAPGDRPGPEPVRRGRGQAAPRLPRFRGARARGAPIGGHLRRRARLRLAVEQEVAGELARRGMVVHRQVGCGGFRIDLALMDPDRPGRYVLGVECDGATYHSSATARDRDRLRQAVLESLGWRISRVWSTDWAHDPSAPNGPIPGRPISRVWSTDWAHDPSGQIDRVLAAFTDARDAPDTPALDGAGSGGPEPADLALPEPEPGPPTVRLPGPPSYGSIADVPESAIRDVLLDALVRFGAARETDLVSSVSHRLGFKRTGTLIKARLGRCLYDLAREGKVARTEGGGVLALAPVNPRSG